SLEHQLKSGHELVAGERIGIARALYRQPDVLFLDEATSALDGLTEQRVMRRIRDSHPHRTLIVIAHRLRTVSRLDRICFLREGTIVDSGSYEDLLERNPEFRAMADAAEADNSVDH
ncbi:ABC transporter ATP-binding protein, partial [Gemmatimonadota bacterium]